jgi:hypothetical protein
MEDTVRGRGEEAGARADLELDLTAWQPPV